MKIASKDISAVSLVQEALDKAKKYADYNIFISMNEEAALNRAKEIDAKIAKGEKAGVSLVSHMRVKTTSSANRVQLLLHPRF